MSFGRRHPWAGWRTWVSLWITASVLRGEVPPVTTIEVHPDARGIEVVRAWETGTGGLWVAGTIKLGMERSRYFAFRTDPDDRVAWHWNFAPPAAWECHLKDAIPDGEGGMYLTGSGGTTRLHEDGRVGWYQRWPGVCLAIPSPDQLFIGGTLKTNVAWGLVGSDGEPLRMNRWRQKFRQQTTINPHIDWSEVSAGALARDGTWFIWGWFDGGFVRSGGSWRLGTAVIQPDGNLLAGHFNHGASFYGTYEGPNSAQWRLVGAVPHPVSGAWLLAKIQGDDGREGAWLVHARTNQSTWKVVEASERGWNLDEDWQFQRLVSGLEGDVWVVGTARTGMENSPGPLPAGGMYVARFSSEGEPLWKASFLGDSHARQVGYDAAPGKGDALWVTGTSRGGQDLRAVTLKVHAQSGELIRRSVYPPDIQPGSTRGQVVVATVDGGCRVLGEHVDGSGRASLLLLRYPPDPLAD